MANNPQETERALGIEIPTPQLRDIYKRWKGLEPTGVEEVDRAREYYIGLLRKKLQERGALPSDNPGQRPEEQKIPAAVIGLGLGLGAVTALFCYVVARAASSESHY